MRVLVISLSLVSSLAISACGGGGGSSGNTTASDPATLLKASQSSNYPRTYDTSVRLSLGAVVNTSLSYRWNIERDGLIPVLYSNRKAEFDAGFDAIEAAVGRQLFDRTTWTGKTSADVARTQRIVIVGEYQTLVMSPTCGLVTPLWLDQTSSIVPPYPVIWGTNINNLPVPVSNYPTNSVVVTVNFNSASGCANSADLVIHEVGHALGLTGHVEGFGVGPLNSPLVLSMLKKLYSIPPGTDKATIQ